MTIGSQLPPVARRLQIAQPGTQRHRIDPGFQPGQHISGLKAAGGDAVGQRGAQGLPQPPPMVDADTHRGEQLDDAAAQPAGLMHLGGAHHPGHQQQLPFGRPLLQL